MTSPGVARSGQGDLSTQYRIAIKQGATGREL